MSTREMDELLHNLGTIVAAEAARAYMSPGTIAGTVLHPYTRTTISVEPHGIFVISGPGGTYRSSQREQALPRLFDAWLDELQALRNTPRFYEAIRFINGPCLKAAESFIASHR